MSVKGGQLSRSRRKNPIASISTDDGEKEYKRIWHRQMRAMTRHRLLEPDLDAILLPLDKKEVGNDRDVGKCGRRFFDPREFPKLMRK